MRSLLTLTLSFALLCAYLELVPHHQHDAMPGQANMAKVVRTPQPTREVIIQDRVETLAQHNVVIAPATPLDLSIPAFNNAVDMGHAVKETIGNWFQRSDKNKVRYNAQLLFDEKEGADIRGGQVNIIVPFG